LDEIFVVEVRPPVRGGASNTQPPNVKLMALPSPARPWPRSGLQSLLDAGTLLGDLGDKGSGDVQPSVRCAQDHDEWHEMARSSPEIAHQATRQPIRVRTRPQLEVGIKVEGEGVRMSSSS